MVKRIRVLTFNIFTGKFHLDQNRIKNQIEQVKALDCDIMCFQEAWDRKIIDLYREKLEDEYDIITCNSNFKDDQHQTLLLGRGGMLQRLCVVFFSIFFAAFSGTILKSVWRCCKLPQYGFITGDIMGLMILVRKGLNSSGAFVKYVESSAYAEVFSRQAAKETWRLLGFIERFFIVKGYLSLDVEVDEHTIGVTNIHFNTGTKNKLRMGQIHELFRKAISSNRPSIMCGDANTEADQPEIHGRMIDTFKEYGKVEEGGEPEGYTWHEGNPLTRQGFLVDDNMRIDYIWFRNNGQESDKSEDIVQPLKVSEGPFSVSHSSVVMNTTPFTSDHYGVLVELHLN